jgi:hypothetical protein
MAAGASNGASGQRETGDLQALLKLARNPFRLAGSLVHGGLSVGITMLACADALPRIALALDRLLPAVQAVADLSAQGTLNRLEELGTFVAEELPESQHQLEALRRELGTLTRALGELGPQLSATTGSNKAVTESVRSLNRTLGVVREANDLLGKVLDGKAEVSSAPSSAR